ncbi:Outer membrane receptor for ferrienterochelin and colicins [Arsukibacterium tuosuense]|uniref:Outer membrane receptor for ferrienterochelin and colicins n=1 Tax=Arsukibacterium tuosuense TaxID=1323745 RepID=A0A285IWN0_9GAMM|nr:TonB-dependent receptor [Arsukibacterium tuosuense]SNY52445.1 Outer membrane receptor for ferrienterochelin and colicins [Arsukibacterium tuosuense]
MLIRYTVLIKSLLLCVVSMPLQAQQVPSLEELLQQPTTTDPALIEVSTSARHAQSAGESSQVTYIVTDEEIRRFSLRNLEQILSFFPGLYVSSDSSYGYLTARGIGRPGDYNARILLLVDGTRVNDNIYDAGMIGNNFYIDPQLIDRVEYSPGSGSALYGNNAFLGVVNVITKRGNKLQDAQLAVAANQRDQLDLSLSYGLRHASGHEGWLSLSRSQQDDIAVADINAPAILTSQRTLNEDLNHKVAASYRYRRLQLQMAGVSRTRQEPMLLAEDPSRSEIFKIKNRNYFVSLQHELRLSEQTELYSHLSTNGFDLTTFTPFVFPTGEIRRYLFDVTGKWTNLDLRLSYTPDPSHHLLFGIDGQHDQHQSYQFSIDDIIPLLGVSSDNNRIGLYLQHGWQLSANHKFISGFRYDYTKQNVREFSPKLGWVWQVSNQQSVRLSYGTAFRAPNEYEQKTNLYNDLPVPESELISTLEANWQAQLDNGWSVGASIYHSRVRNLITGNYGESAIVQFFNDRSVEALGLETTAAKNWQTGAKLQLSASVQRAHYNTDQLELTNSPEQLFKTQFSQPLWQENIHLNWHMFAASARTSPSWQMPGYARHDVLLSWQPNPQLSIVLGLKNVFDKTYVDAPLPSAAILRQPGRSAELSINWNFR